MQGVPAASSPEHLSAPQGPSFHASSHEPADPSSSTHSRKPWNSSRLSSFRTGRSQQQHPHTEVPAAGAAASSSTQNGKAKWWKIHLFRGIIKDIKRRAPYYWSDWIDAWDYRVVPATVYMFFAKCVSPPILESGYDLLT